MGCIRCTSYVALGHSDGRIRQSHGSSEYHFQNEIMIYFKKLTTNLDFKLLFPRVIGMYVISGIAFAIYLLKIPERWCAGKFDFIGHSHQWWHLFVVLALYYWHNSGMMYVQYRMNHGCANTMRIF